MRFVTRRASRSPPTPAPAPSAGATTGCGCASDGTPTNDMPGSASAPRLDQTAGTKTFWNVNARQYGPATDEMYCSVPVFLAHRPDVTYGFFLNTPRLGADPMRAGIRTRGSPRSPDGELDYVVAHGDGPADGARTAHRAASAGSSCHRGGRSAITSRTGATTQRPSCAASPTSSPRRGLAAATLSTSTSTTWTATGCSRGTRSASPIRPG